MRVESNDEIHAIQLNMLWKNQFGIKYMSDPAYTNVYISFLSEFF